MKAAIQQRPLTVWPFQGTAGGRLPFPTIQDQHPNTSPDLKHH